jgi:murein DD-endopeptidase MepM/ murein hydrolase activator NlpD
MPPTPKNWGVPFAPATGDVWPVVGQPKIVPYTAADGAIVGNAGTAFHASREGGARYHAGVDLVCAPGDAVVAMESGRVVGQIPGFVRLGAVAIAHPTVVAVYAEIALDSLAAAGLKPGDTVSAGQRIGTGAQNYAGRSMLHLELWAPGHAPAAYTPWYQTAPAAPLGLLDPTPYLLALAAGASADTGGSHVGELFAAAAIGFGILALLRRRR